MPEYAEVEAFKRHLTPWAEGGRLSEPHYLEGMKMLAWERQGKRLFVPFEGGGGLRLQLGMTGKLIAIPAEEAPLKFERLRLVFRIADERRAIAFVDRRHLGKVGLVQSREEAFAGLGPDALTLTSGEALSSALLVQGAKKRLKDALMDQALVAGLGNIAAIEMCFRAQLSPMVVLAKLDSLAWERLCEALHAHFQHALSDSLAHPTPSYVSDGGPNPFYIYGREHEPCPRCQRPLSRAVHAQRPTYWCERCQPSL